jgi:hypothetical protein
LPSCSRSRIFANNCSPVTRISSLKFPSVIVVLPVAILIPVFPAARGAVRGGATPVAPAAPAPAFFAPPGGQNAVHDQRKGGTAMADQDRNNENRASGTAWSEHKGAQTEVPEGGDAVTAAEEREAAEHTPDTPAGRRGDLGDSGPGED